MCMYPGGLVAECAFFRCGFPQCANLRSPGIYFVNGRVALAIICLDCIVLNTKWSMRQKKGWPCIPSETSNLLHQSSTNTNTPIYLHSTPDCFDHNIGINGNDLAAWNAGGSVVDVKHAVECQRLCQAKVDCKFFVYGMSDHAHDLSRRRCFFKTGKTSIYTYPKTVTGPKFCWSRLPLPISSSLISLPDVKQIL